MKTVFNRKGVSALTLVVVIGAAGLVMIVGAAMMGLDQLEQDYVSTIGNEVRNGADACAEEALERLRLDENYAGGSLNVGLSACIMGVQTNANVHSIFVTSTQDTFMQRIHITASRNGDVLTITEWDER